MPEELWTEVCNILQEAVTKTIPKQKKCNKAKWLSEEALQSTEKRRDVKDEGEKERYTHLNAEVLIFHSVAQLCPILCNPMVCSTPAFTAGSQHGSPHPWQGHVGEFWWARWARIRGVPLWACLSIYAKTRVCLFYCFMTFTNSSDSHGGLSPTTFSLKEINLEL